MRSFVVALAFLTLGSALAWADTVYTVNMRANFTATQPCVSNCSEDISATFQYQSTEIDNQLDWVLVPGSFSMTSSGFLGTFDTVGSFHTSYIPTFNGSGDELDLLFNVINPQFEPEMGLYACESQACVAGFAPQFPFGVYIYQTKGVGIVTTSEADLLPFLLLSFGAVSLRKLALPSGKLRPASGR